MMNTKKLQKAVLESEVNMNGEISITHPAEITKQQADHIAIELIKQAIGRKLACKKTGVTVQMTEGEVWSSQGKVQVGNLFFEVEHDTARRCSAAKVDIEPEPDEFGSGLLRARIGAYVHPNMVYVTAEDPETGLEKTLAVTRFDGLDISCHLCEPAAEDNGKLHTLNQVRHRGFTKWNN